MSFARAATRGAVGLFMALALLPTLLHAQTQQTPIPGVNPLGGTMRGGSTVPTDFYFDVFRAYFDGNYDDALRGFISEGRGAIKTAESNWIDSICYHTMAGECHYQMGQLPQALSHYNSALQLYVAFYDWMIRVQFSSTVTVSNSGQMRQPPWGRKQRAARVGVYAEIVPTMQGRIDNNAQYQQGGTVQPAQLFPIRPIEIIRCTALAIKRRGELLGPLAEHDTLGKEALAALARRPTQPNHWTEAWIDAQLGIAYLAIGKPDQAQPVLERSLVVGGELDHPLTAMVLVELGRIALLRTDFATAARCFEEATYAAYQFGDLSAMEEAFRYGLTTHLMSGRPEPYPPLAAAAQWAKASNYRQMQVSMLLLAAEDMAALGQTKRAQSLLADARAAAFNRSMLRGRIGARLQYLLAVTSYQAGQFADGDTAISNLLSFQQNGSHWLYQIRTADNLYLDGSLSPRAALLSYQRLLREPDGFDWGYDPIESLSVLSTPHSQSYENWFVSSLERDKQAAFAVADEVRRHRFLSTLPIGGRVLGLRWLMEGPPELLDRAASLARQSIAVKYPAYDQLSRQARDLRTQLAQLPLVSDDQASRDSQARLVAALAEVSAQQEQLLREMAVKRNPGALLFPPKRSLKNVQASLSEGQAVLSFLTTSSGVYGFLVTGADYDVWPIEAPGNVHRSVLNLLRELGHTDFNRELSQEHLQGEKWKRQAADLFNMLTRNTKSRFPEGITELAIVPDRSLWYVPFAALQLGPQNRTEPLIAKVQLRFAPTTGLAVGDSRGLKRQMNTLVAMGKLHPRTDLAAADMAFDELAQILPGAIALRGKPPAPSHVFSCVVDRLIVLDEVDNNGGIYGWSPFQTDQGAPGSSVDDWMMLPWGAPDQVFLPAVHSAAANGFKGQSSEFAGDDLFLGICALMASGSRTILISQWRTGGQSSFDMIRELVQELPNTTAADAWQRSVALAMDSRINSDGEPRVGKTRRAEAPKCEHPFFWAGYLLIDPGQAGQKPDEPQVGIAMNAPAAGGDGEGDNPPAGGAAPVQLGGPAAPANIGPIGGFANDDGQQGAKRGRQRPAPRNSRPRRAPVSNDVGDEGDVAP